MQMSLEQFLNFLMAHNASIIEVLLGLTLLAVVFLSIRSFMIAKDPSSASAGMPADFSELEDTLKQLLEKAGQVPTAAAASEAGVSEDNQKLLSEIAELKLDLELKKTQLEEIKIQLASGPSITGSSGGAAISAQERTVLEEKIAELTAKLSEYEIISEDIADLSFYKEQNAKLQKELESLKVNAMLATRPAPSVPTPSASSSSEEPAAAAPAEVADSESVATAETPVAPAEEVAASPEPTGGGIDDDLMAEFAAAVEKQKTGGLEEGSSLATEEAPLAASAPEAQAEAPSEPAGDADVDLGEMDMDKMMAEAETIKTDDSLDVKPEDALGTGLDEDKLIQEAAALEGVTPEDKKLMGDFENFVKKNES